eukprot:15440907-Alexandrium_andersonii.AAC.1
MPGASRWPFRALTCPEAPRTSSSATVVTSRRSSPTAALLPAVFRPAGGVSLTSGGLADGGPR